MLSHCSLDVWFDLFLWEVRLGCIGGWVRDCVEAFEIHSYGTKLCRKYAVCRTLLLLKRAAHHLLLSCQFRFVLVPVQQTMQGHYLAKSATE